MTDHYSGCWHDHIECARERIALLETQCNNWHNRAFYAERALKHYGVHHNTCQIGLLIPGGVPGTVVPMDEVVWSQKGCTCGFDATLRGEGKGET